MFRFGMFRGRIPSKMNWESVRGMATAGISAVPRRRWRGLIITASVIGGYAGYIYAWRENLFSLQKDRENKPKLLVLGTGWASVALLRHIDTKLYDVQCISPRNYFLMTPLLPSVSVGTVETRTVVEPVRPLVGTNIKFLEAECVDIDPEKKRVVCQGTPSIDGSQTNESQFSQRDVADNIGGSSSRRVHDGARTRPPFELDYDFLVVAVGAENNTFNTPGVDSHAHFLKELPDARRIRAAISDCFESASIPTQTEEERKRLLSFVVVGGGPTGVEFAAELSDMVHEDLSKNFPQLDRSEIRISLVEALDHVLSMYDHKISEYTEKHFDRENISVLNSTFVKEVKQREVVLQKRGSQEKGSLPCGMVVWATGIKPRPFVNSLRKRVGELQSNPRAVVTDTYLRVIGAPSMYAMGDCSSIQMPKVGVANLVPDGTKELGFDEFAALLKDRMHEYPQLESYAQQVKASFEKADLNGDGKLQISELKVLLDEADKLLRPLPATAQVANQEGKFLAQHLNKLALGNDANDLEPFRYRHLGSLAYVGGDKAVIDFSGRLIRVCPVLRVARIHSSLFFGDAGTGLFQKFFGLEPINGRGAFYLWRSFYLTEMVTLRTKILLAFDWLRSKLFGRDISRV
uniref:EF-hand domain-containing protein n=2 Tax=Rhodosorus marinus TaxID=101924 RepID=A0A7S3EF62_9RHOD|mmetsp:Transcript_31785/g.123338  ORF Transcript_31785/g.123338 Transcript_31785/m.123338 type:complete len:632 (+) Transcript_31785:69-1964(+)